MTGTPERDIRFDTFCVLWAVAHLVDVAEAEPTGWDRLPAVLVVAAAFALLHRATVERLAVLALAQLVAFASGLPPTSNHSLLLAAVNVAVVVGILTRGQHAGQRHRWMPAARVVLLVGYTAAAVSKYNDTFFDPIASCATFVADKASYGVLGAGLEWPLILAVAGAETAIAVLLLLPRTRWLGVRIGLTFHFLVSASPAAGVRDFTATLFALFVLFAPEADVAAARDRLSGWARDRAVVEQVRQFPGLNATIGAATGAWMVAFSPEAARGASWVLFTALGAAIVVAVWRTAPGGQPTRLGRLRPGDSIVVAAVVLVAAGPYLGFGTAPAFTPFSNLRTEGPGTNHLFLPSIHLIDQPNQILRIESASSPELEELVDEGFGLVGASARVAAATDPDLILVGMFTPSGRAISGPAAEALEPPSFWERRVLSFRPVADPDAPRCTA